MALFFRLLFGPFHPAQNVLFHPTLTLDEMPERLVIRRMLFEEYDEQKDRQAKIDSGAMMKEEEHTAGLKAAVEMLKPLYTDFDSLCRTLKSNPLYRDASEEEIRRYCQG